MNKNVPVRIDAYTVLVSTAVFPSKTVRYTYTVTVPEGADVATLEPTMRPMLEQTIRTALDMAELREMEVSFNYYYKEKRELFCVNSR